MRLDSPLKIISLFSFKSLRMDFVHDPIFNFSNFLLISFICASSFKMASWGTPSSRRSVLEFWLFVNKWNRIPLQFPEARRTWVFCRSTFDICIVCSDRRTQFPGARRRTTREWLLLLMLLRMPIAPVSHLRRRLRGWESFEQRSISALRYYSRGTICRHRIVYDHCTWLRPPESQSLVLFSGQFYTMFNVLIMFPFAMIVHFAGNCEVITGCFFVWIFSERVEKCKEDGLSSLLALFSSRNGSFVQDGSDAEGTTPVKHKLFPIVRN